MTPHDPPLATSLETTDVYTHTHTGPVLVGITTSCHMSLVF